MEFSCQIPSCCTKAVASCTCDFKITLCAPHFFGVHKNLLGNHNPIVISDIAVNFYAKTQEAYQKLKKAENAIISKGYLMVNQIQSVIKKNLSKLIAKEKEIESISKSKNNLQETFELLEKVIKFEVIDEPLDNFEEIIKNYLRFNSNCNEPEPVKIEIKKLIEDNQKMKEEIYMLNKYLIRANSQTNFNDLLTMQNQKLKKADKKISNIDISYSTIQNKEETKQNIPIKSYSVWEEIENLLKKSQINKPLKEFEVLYDPKRFQDFYAQYPSSSKKYLVSQRNLKANTDQFQIQVNIYCKDPVIIVASVTKEGNNYIRLQQPLSYLVLYKIRL